MTLTSTPVDNNVYYKRELQLCCLLF